MNDILSIGNDVEFSGKHKGVFERSFSKKDLGEAAYILNIKIYRDCSDSTRMDQVSVLKCHPWIGMLTHTVLEDL